MKCLTSAVIRAVLAIGAAPSIVAAQTPVPVVWLDKINVITTGPQNNGLQKTSGQDSSQDAGAYSQQLITSSGYIEFTAIANNKDLWIGLTTGDGTGMSFSFPWSIRLSEVGTAEVRESTAYVTEWNYAAGDTFRIAVAADGTVTYTHNGGQPVVSATHVAAPVKIDTLFTMMNGGVSNVLIAGSGQSSGGGSGGAYSADTSRDPRPEPALPSLGPAGYRFTDPTFGSAIIRVTDANTRPATTDDSFGTPSAAHQNAWNVDSTYFYIGTSTGVIIPYQFNPATGTASRIQPTPQGEGGATITVVGSSEPNFSLISPHILYATRFDSTLMHPIVRKIDFSQGFASTDILDLAQVASLPPQTQTYALAVYSSASSPERISIAFGGTHSNDYPYLVVFDADNPANRVLLDTARSQVVRNGQTYPTNVALNIKIHEATLDKSGRYVLITTPDRVPAPKVLWDTQALGGDGFTLLSESYHPNGHEALGWGMMINQDCCTTTSPWNQVQWQKRALATPAQMSDLLLQTTPGPSVHTVDHTSWNNAAPDQLLPVLSSTYRMPDDTQPARAWDDEIIAIKTATGGDDVVWRFAHHRSNISDDLLPNKEQFIYEPRAVISQDGNWALFTSNWEKSLGLTAYGDADGAAKYRRDVFIVKLREPGTGSGGAEAAQWTNPVNVSAPAGQLTKNGGCEGCHDAGAVSVQQIASSGGSVQFTAASAADYSAGLSNDTSASTTNPINYAFHIWSFGVWEVRESGTWRVDGNYAPGDRFRVAVESGVVRYYVNDSLVYASALSPQFPLAFDVSLLSVGASITNVQIQR